jgi:quinoprotein glucose dehydrogenase
LKLKALILVFTVSFFLSIGFVLYKSIDMHAKVCTQPKVIYQAVSDLGLNHWATCFHVEQTLVNLAYLYIYQSPIEKHARKFFYIINPNQHLIRKKAVRKYDFIKNSIDPAVRDSLYEKQPMTVKGIINDEQFIKNYAVKEPPMDHEMDSWTRSHGGYRNIKFSRSDQINSKNIKDLKLVWKYESFKPENFKRKWIDNVELNPVFFNGILYTTTSDRRIVALDVSNGKEIWSIQTLGLPARRGMVFHQNSTHKSGVLILPIGDRIYKIDALTGERVKSFGKSGYVSDVTSLAAPVVYKDKIWVASISPPSIFGYDILTGEKLSEIAIHDSEKNFSGGISWGGTALDSSSGTLFFTTGNPRPTLYGVTRPGPNKNSNSIMAVDLNEERILWAHQDVVHGLWDYDIGFPPALTEIRVKGKNIAVVIAVSKVGNTAILERESGRPIFDVNYRKAPASSLANEITSPVQIDSITPKRLFKLEYDLSDLDGMPEEKKKRILRRLKKSKFGWFEPPMFGKNLILMGLHGGAMWPGAAINPITQKMFVPINRVPFFARVYGETRSDLKPENKPSSLSLYNERCSECHGLERNGIIDVTPGEKLTKFYPSLVGVTLFPDLIKTSLSFDYFKEMHSTVSLTQEEHASLIELLQEWDQILYQENKIIVRDKWAQFLDIDDSPGSSPPWGKVVALDLKTGKIDWETPTGAIGNDKDRTIVGTPTYGGLSATGGDVIFSVGTDDRYVYALDAKTGEIIWSYEMDAAGSTPPTIYTHNGKQMISVLATGGLFHHFKEKASAVYTFSLQ